VWLLINKIDVIVRFTLVLIIVLVGCQQQSLNGEQTTPDPRDFTQEIAEEFLQKEYVALLIEFKDWGPYRPGYAENITREILEDLDEDQYELITVFTNGFIAELDKNGYTQLLKKSEILGVYPNTKSGTKEFSRIK